MKKRIAGAFLALVMIVSLFPVSALAAGDERTAVTADRIETVTVNGITANTEDGLVAFTVDSKEDTANWDQDSGVGSNQDYTYVGLHITAPEGAVSLTFNDEGDANDMDAPGAGFFTGGKFQHWIPVAEKKGDSFRLFYGGREYNMLIDWYDADGALISSEYVKVTRDLADDLAVAQVGDYTHETLADAVDAAKTGETVKLLRSTEGSGVKVSGDGNRNITIDLNNCTYTIVDPTVGSSGTETNGFQLLKGSTVTIKNGQITAKTSQARILFQNYCNLTLDNVTVDCTGSNCEYVSSNNCGNAVIKDSTLIAADGQAAFDLYYWPSNGYTEGVSVTVEGDSVITGRIEYGSDGTKDDVADKAQLNIADGAFTGSFYTYGLGSDSANINITGGTFTAADGSAWDVSDYVVPGMMQDEDGNIVINTEDAVASVNGVGYTSLDAAIAAADTGDTITLLKNLPLESTVTLNKAVTLTAASGVTVTAYDVDTSFVLSNGAALDGLTINLGVKSMNQVIMMQTNSTVRNCTITGQYQLGDSETSRAIVGQAGATDLTITGNTFKNLRQPAYINNCTGTISDNYVDGTRGWVICGSSDMTITGNTFGENAVDIAIISDNGTNNYAKETTALSTANGGAYVQNQPALAEAEDGVLVVGRTDGYTLDKAFAEAKSGDTVKLEANVESATAITVPAGITLDGNGKTITCTAAIDNGAFVNAGGNNVTIKNVTIDTDGYVKHGVQFYCVEGGKFSGVTVNGGRYTSVVINGATNIVLENCTMNPDDGSYANVEFGMGSGVSTIPSLTVNNVTGDSDKALLYVDQTTLDRIKGVLGGEADNQDAIDKVKTSVTNTGSSSVTIDLPGSGDITVDPPYSGGGSSVTTYSVTVESVSNGTVSASSKSASKGSIVTITVTPDSGYALDTLTVTDKDGKEVELTKVNDTKYTFKMPASKVTVKASFVKTSTLPFTDVAADAWYYDAVAYVYEKGMMTGTNDGTTFSPAMNLTRGMMAQVLFNIEKGTAPAEGSFTDVTADAWYAGAVNWAAANGIVGGYGNGKFGPEDSITREQMAVLLYNYAKFKGEDMTATADLSTFSDGDQVSDWAEYAMKWAVGEKLINGSNNALNPLGTACRAEVAQILMNYFNK